MECPVCYESFSKDITIPKILTKCGHTICQACLNNYTKASSTVKIKCPFCKIEYSVSEAQSAPTNFYILNMLNETDQTAAKQKKKLETRTCSMHASTQMDFFCKTDKTYLCGKCLLSGEHLNHVIVHVDDELSSYKANLNHSIKSLEEKFSRISISKEKFEASLEEYQSITRQVVVDLDKKFNEVLNMIVKRREELIENFIRATTSMNEYLKGKVGFFNKLQETVQEYITESKEIKKKMGTPSFDLRKFQPFEDTKFVKEIAENLLDEFDWEKRKSKASFEDIMEQVETTRIDFSQSPFFVFNENILKDFLEDYAKMTLFNFGLRELQIENELLLGGPSKSDDKLGRKKVKMDYLVDSKENIKMEEEKTEQIPNKSLNGSEKMFGNKDIHNFIDSKINNQLNEVGLNNMQGINEAHITVNAIRDPFMEFQLPGTTICLLGHSDKALYINETGHTELISLEFEFTRPEDKKGSIFKNFGACAFFDRNKVIYTGGGPSLDAYLLEFKTKKNVVVTALPNMSHKRCWHGSVYVLPYVYVIGGFDGSNRLSQCERLNVQDSSHNPHFEPIAPMNEARSLFGYTVCKDNMIYVAGGLAAKRNTDSIERYCVIRNSWELLKIRLPQKLSGVSCLYFEHEDKIRIFGGSDNMKKSIKSVYEIDLKDGKVHEVKSMYRPRQMNNKVFKKNDMLYLIGGNNTNNECEVWNLASKGKDFLFNYGDVTKGDLNNFCGFTI